MNIFGGHSRNDENRKYIGAKAAIAKLIINYHNLGCVLDKLFIFDLTLMFSWSSYAMVKNENLKIRSKMADIIKTRAKSALTNSIKTFI